MQFFEQVGQDKNNVIENFAKNESKNIEFINKDIYAMLDHDIISNSKLTPNSTTKDFFN